MRVHLLKKLIRLIFWEKKNQTFDESNGILYITHTTQKKIFLNLLKKKISLKNEWKSYKVNFYAHDYQNLCRRKKKNHFF